MTRRLLRSRRPVLVALASLLAITCVVSTTTRSERVETSALAATTVRSPIKAHMMDGSVVVFPEGAGVPRDSAPPSSSLYRRQLPTDLNRSVG